MITYLWITIELRDRLSVTHTPYNDAINNQLAINYVLSL